MALFTNNNRPKVEGEEKYFPWRFAKAGDIVFNTNPILGDFGPSKLGYIGYMCVQDGIVETNGDGYVVFVEITPPPPPLNTISVPKMAQEAKWQCFGKILIVCLFFLFTQLTQAQGWVKLYGNEQDEEVGSLTLLNNNGNMMMRASVRKYDLLGNSLGYGNSLWVLNTEGDTLYTKLKGNTVSILPTADGNYLLGGSYQFGNANTTHGYMCKINTLGDTIWTQGAATGYAIEQANGSFLTVRTTFVTNENCWGIGVSTPESVLLSANGATIAGSTSTWFNYSSPGSDCSYLYSTVTDILDVGDNKFMIACTTDNPENVFEDMNLVVMFEGTDLENPIWENKSVHGGAYKLLPSPDGNYLAIGYVHSEQNSYPTGSRITKYSTTGDTLWSKTISDTLVLSRSILDIGENKHLAMMNSYSGNAYLSMFNENWDIVWQKTYDFPNNLGLGGLLVAPNSGYYISGRYYPYTNNKSDIILLKTDSLGNCTPKANFSLAQQDSLLRYRTPRLVPIATSGT